MKRVLHAGAGDAPLPPELGFGTCDEVRLDIDPSQHPHIVANMLDMGEIGLFDAVYCCHALEHFYPHEVPLVLDEFQRVLKPDGYAMIVVPDLTDVRPTEDVIYTCPSGPITGLDMYYGHHLCIPASPHMAHHCGFVRDTLEQVMREAGFASVTVLRMEFIHSLLAIAKRVQ